jgi:hypothetical protein
VTTRYALKAGRNADADPTVTPTATPTPTPTVTPTVNPKHLHTHGYSNTHGDTDTNANRKPIRNACQRLMTVNHALIPSTQSNFTGTSKRQ